MWARSSRRTDQMLQTRPRPTRKSRRQSSFLKLGGQKTARLNQPRPLTNRSRRCLEPQGHRVVKALCPRTSSELRPYNTPMILLIDNYDSFTYNLVQRLGELDRNIALEVYRNDKITPK